MNEDDFFSRGQTFPMSDEAKVRVLEQLEAAGARDGQDAIMTPQRRHKYRYWLGTTAAGAAAVIIAGTVVLLLQHAGQRNTVATNHPEHTRARPAAANSYRALLGFQPLLPTVKPKDIVSESTQVQLVDVNPVPARTSKAPHPSKQFVMRFVLKNDTIPHQHELIVSEESAASVDLERINPSMTVTVAGYHVAESENLAEYYVVKDGVFYSVFGVGITAADQVKVLESLKKPVTGTPPTVVRQELTQRAVSELPFTLVQPTIPKGYAMAGPPIIQMTTTKHGSGTAATYQAQYFPWRAPNDITVFEWIDRQSGLKTLPAIKGQKETVNGQTVYYDSTYRQYSWENPRTHVCFQVGGGVDNAAAAHKQLRAIVASMIQ